MLLDAVNGRLLARLTSADHQAVERAHFSHDGRVVAAATSDGSVLVWTVATRQVTEILRGHAGAVTDLAFSPDDATLYTGGQDGTILVWDVKGDRRFAPRRAAIEHCRSRGRARRRRRTGRQSRPR